MAGNALILKHASNVPGCTVAIGDIFRKAGFPEHLFQNFLISTRDAERLIEHPAICAVNLTGSKAAGQAVSARAGKWLKKRCWSLTAAILTFLWMKDNDDQMKKTLQRIISMGLVLLWLPGCSPARMQEGIHLDQIEMPPGFKISLYARVPGARSMALAAGGMLFVGTRDAGKVYAVLDNDGDHTADEIVVVAENLHVPNGVAVHDGSLYVAEINRVLRFDDIEADPANPGEAVVVNDSFPTDEHHGWKHIAFGPDGRLYIPVGAPCNICEREDPRYASIMRMAPDGRELEIFARGVRNTVGFDWHPKSKELWFTDNGRDWMGDDRPPDELNRASEEGLHFGFPYCHAGRIADPEFGEKRPCQEFHPPAIELGPHVAALGMKFYAGRMFPEPYRHQIFIAEHGSWNRTVPIGYRITLVRLVENRAVAYEVFAKGWLQNGRAWGRPVDVLVMPDGALLVSDDRAGGIYRIYYEP